MRRQRVIGVFLVLAAGATGCFGGDTPTVNAPPATSTTAMPPVTAPTSVPTDGSAPASPDTPEPSAATPLVTSFVASVGPVDEARLGLSWRVGCPVAPKDLRLMTISYWGFDDVGHTGELIVNQSIAVAVVAVFRELWDARFPINRMDTAEKFATPADFAPDGSFIETHGPDLVNDSSAFFCRPSTGSKDGWSEHSYGTAIDINPVQNPYVKGTTVIPPNGTAARDAAVPGTITKDSVVVAAMKRSGLKWGGNWSSLKDWMHFSVNGR